MGPAGGQKRQGQGEAERETQSRRGGGRGAARQAGVCEERVPERGRKALQRRASPQNRLAKPLAFPQPQLTPLNTLGSPPGFEEGAGTVFLLLFLFQKGSLPLPFTTSQESGGTRSQITGPRQPPL